MPMSACVLLYPAWQTSSESPAGRIANWHYAYLAGEGQRLFEHLEGMRIMLKKTSLVETGQRTDIWLTVQSNAENFIFKAAAVCIHSAPIRLKAVFVFIVCGELSLMPHKLRLFLFYRV
jgi:hypothetical protein